LLELLERFPVCCDPVKIPEPFEHKGRWCVQLPAKLSLTGKRQQLYYATETDAKKDIKERFGEALEHGRSGISTGERQMVAYARQQLGGDLRLLPEIIAHWRATGTGSVTPITFRMPSRRSRLGVSRRLALEPRFRHTVETRRVRRGVQGPQLAPDQRRRARRLDTQPRQRLERVIPILHHEFAD
jgi:hypothetical protein